MASSSSTIFRPLEEGVGGRIPLSVTRGRSSEEEWNSVKSRRRAGDLAIPHCSASFDCRPSAAGSAPPAAQIQCKDMVLDEHDVAKLIMEFSAHVAIEKLIVGTTVRGSFVRFKADIPTTISKGVPDFCTVYILNKGKVASTRNAIRASTTTGRCPLY